MLPLLSDEMLLEAHYHARRLKLDREFIHLLKAEIARRNLVPTDEQVG